MNTIQFLLLGSLLLSSTSASWLKGMSPPKSRRLLKLKGPKERTCEFSSRRHEVQFECKSKTGGDVKGSSKDMDEAMTRGISLVPDLEIKDKIKYKVKTTQEGIQVKLEYKNEVTTEGTETQAETETETKTQFELLFLSLVEYVKGGGSAPAESEAYDWDTDRVVQTIALTDWNDLSDVMDDDAGVVSYFTATSEALGSDGGSATFNFTIARADQDEQITANSMKVDVRILDFPWMEENSYVALMSTFESKKKVKMEYDDQATVSEGRKAKKTKDITVSFNEDGLEDTLGFSTYGQYTWAEDAEVRSMDQNMTVTLQLDRQGGIDMNKDTAETSTERIQVIATSPTEEGTDTFQSISYSFVGPAARGASDIYWDPEAGIGYETAATDTSGSFIRSTTLLIGSLIGATLLAAW